MPKNRNEFNRERILMKEVERLQEVETTSDLELCRLRDENKLLEILNEQLTHEKKELKLKLKALEIIVENCNCEKKSN